MEPEDTSNYLTCERKNVYALLMTTSGMMGAYTFNIRGGVFCNAQTANFVMMAISLGQGNWSQGLYYLIPVFAYFLGAFVSEIIPNPIKKLGGLRWDTYLVGIEILILFGLGFIPLSCPHHVVQITINFIASMQYNTFRQAEGIPMATTFCTNHLRQVGIHCAKFLRKKDPSVLKRGFAHTGMIICFVAGGIILSLSCRWLLEKAIWLAILPLLITFIMLVRADLTYEHELLEQKPSGH